MSKDEATWTEIRRAYEDGSDPVAAIAKRCGVSAGTIYRRARKDCWVRRSSSGKQQKLPQETETNKARRSKSPQASKKSKRSKAKVGRAELAERLYRAIDAKLSRLEARMQSDDDLSAADSERETRELGSMIRSFEKVAALAGDEKPSRQGEPERADSGKRDAERMREEIARRLERLWAHDDQTGSGTAQ